MKYRLMAIGIWAVLCATLGACAAYPDAQYPASQGWRVAHIDHNVSIDESVPVVRFSEDCRFEPGLGRDAAAPPQHWVLLHFRRPPEEVFRVVPSVGGMALPNGEEVYVNVADCLKSMVLRQPQPRSW